MINYEHSKNKWLGRRDVKSHIPWFINQQSVIKAYALVTSASVMSVAKSPNYGPAQGYSTYKVVSLNLTRISDGLESKFESEEDINKIREFLDGAKKDATIDFLKGKVIDVGYAQDNTTVVQVRINKYTILPEDK